MMRMLALLPFALLHISAYLTLASSLGKSPALQQYGVILKPPGLRLFTYRQEERDRGILERRGAKIEGGRGWSVRMKGEWYKQRYSKSRSFLLDALSTALCLSLILR
jgi:hypothetical protein